MNISAWTIYWFIKLDAIINIMGGLGFVSIMTCIIVLCAVVFIAAIRADISPGYYLNKEQADAKIEKLTKYLNYWTKLFKRLIIFPFIFIILSNMLPTTKEMAVIYVIPKIANSNFVNETLPNEMKDIYIMAKEWMKETLKTTDIKVPRVVKSPVEKPEGTKK